MQITKLRVSVVSTPYRRRFRCCPRTTRPDPRVSHYRLRIQPQLITVNGLRCAVGDNADLRWIHRADLHTLGLPAPVRKLLEQTQ